MSGFKFTKKKTLPKRVLLLGSSGIISKNLQEKLKKEKIHHKVFGRKNLNFLKKNSIQKLSKVIKKDDVIIFLASNAPVKNLNIYTENIKICETIFSAINEKLISHLIYISSDAVYSDSKSKLNEKSITEPSNFHGLMHITREKILNLKFKKKLCILRPTMIYGKFDSHLGYGPNLFLENTLKKNNIKIFGNGEERRDHVFIDDLIKILFICISKRGIGVANVASGKIYSFYNIAKKVIKITGNKVKLTKIKRKGPMPHNGYRPFNVSLLKDKFPTVKLTTFNNGIKKYIESLK